MRSVKVITDSCANMGKELRDRYDVDYARLSILWDGNEKYVSNDWELYTAKELYDAMRGGTRITTQQVNAVELEQVFEKYLELGLDVVYVACSSALSGSYSVGQVVAKQLKEKYRERNVICIDPKISCGGEAIVAMEAAKLALAGGTADEVAECAKKAAAKSMQVGTIDSLTYLKRAGRVKASAAFFGNLFGIKPILISNEKGENEAVKKMKGRKNALDECVNMLVKSIGCDEYPTEEQTLFVVHADCENDAMYLVNRIKEKVNLKEVIVNALSPVIGATTGPGMVGLYAFGDRDAMLGE